MARCNRVDPWGDLHAVAERGMFTGNRGILVEADDGPPVRHHASSLWITCVLEFRERRHPVAARGKWTALFFLDDAVALAAGHRPCGECRRVDYRAYRDAVTTAVEAEAPLGAGDLDRLLRGERLRRGRGLARRQDRMLWQAPVGELPIGTVVLSDAAPALVGAHGLQRFSFAGWQPSRIVRPDTQLTVLTPPSSVAALRNGFVPILHPSAAAPHRSDPANVDRT